jgi:hypothetical protein
MATSGSYNFGLNAQKIVKESLYDIGAIAVEETPTADEITSALRKLNMMLKAWQAEGLGIWLNQEVVLILQNDVVQYTIGPTGNGHCSALMNMTELAVAAVAADGTITVDSDSAISDGDIIGIELDSTTVDWDVVSGAPVADVVTLTGTVNTAAAVDNHVYSYTALTQRPLEIIEARLRDADYNDTPLDIISRREYQDINDKTTEGSPSSIHYQPTLTNGTLWVWPEPNNMKERIVMTIKRPIMDFDAITDDADFPPEWLEAVITNLDLRLAPVYGVPVHPELKSLAQTSKFEAKGFDRESTSIFFQPDVR